MILQSLSSNLLVFALAAAADGAPECPAGYVCIEASRVPACRPNCETPERCAPARSCDGAGQPVPAVAHREAPAPSPPGVSASSTGASTASSSQPGAASGAGTPGPGSSGRRPGFRDWAVGAAAGLNFGSTVWLDANPGEQTDHEAQTAPAFLVFADKLTSRGFSVGGMLYSTSLDSDYGDASVLGLGATLKTRFRTRSNLELRPGILLSYQKTDIDSFDGPVKGLGAGVLLDVATTLGDSVGIFTTLGVLGQPAGGSGDTDVTWGPALLWMGGIEFGS